MRSGPDQSTTTVAAPSGVQDALVIDVGAEPSGRIQPPVAVPRQGPPQVDGQRRRGGVRVGARRWASGRNVPAAPRRSRTPLGSNATAPSRSRSGDERHRDLAAQPRRGPDHPQPPRQAQRHDDRVGHRAARGTRRHRRRSRRQGRDPHRRRPGVLRRARPRRVRRPAAQRPPRADAARLRHPAADRQPHPAPALAAATGHRRRQRTGRRRRVRPRARLRRPPGGPHGSLQRGLRADRPVGVRHRDVMAAAPAWSVWPGPRS